MEYEEEGTEFYIFTDSMVTIHLIRKSLMRPWMLKGHEHECTIRALLLSISDRGKQRTGMKNGKYIKSKPIPGFEAMSWRTGSLNTRV